LLLAVVVTGSVVGELPIYKLYCFQDPIGVVALVLPSINSFYRSPQLNSAIGGSTTSQHCIGCALDLDDNYGHKTNAEMYEYIKNNLDFDQIIWEFGTDENPNWVHVSYVSEDANRRRCLKAYKENGKTKYKVI